MANLKRYMFYSNENEFGCSCEMRENKNGWYVKFDDIKEFLPSASTNTGSPKSAPDIVESDDICDYCARNSSKCTIFSCDDKHSGFVGRRLRAGA